MVNFPSERGANPRTFQPFDQLTASHDKTVSSLLQHYLFFVLTGKTSEERIKYSNSFNYNIPPSWCGIYKIESANILTGGNTEPYPLIYYFVFPRKTSSNLRTSTKSILNNSENTTRFFQDEE